MFTVCRGCNRGSILIGQQGSNVEFEYADAALKEGLSKAKISLENVFEIRGFIALKDMASVAPPEHLPEDIANAFRQGSTCCATECWDAAGGMFRLCVDLATKSKLPPPGTPGIKRNEREKLAARLGWLFANNALSDDLKDLADCIREDGNDGAHDGTLTEAAALNLQDFTVALLDRLYTQPKRLELAKERRNKRRAEEK